MHLGSVLNEQALLDQQFEDLTSSLEEDSNDLELQARAFCSDQEMLFRSLVEGIGAARRLCSPRVQLLHGLFDLQVDKERGLRYPLINSLRLAYRPTGDVSRKEIQAAWSLAAQLLLIVGLAFDFQSERWKVIPLSHSAKLLYYPPLEGNGMKQGGAEKSKLEAFVLGDEGGESQPLVIWNQLLHSIVRHVTIAMHDAVEAGFLCDTKAPPFPLPYTIAAAAIGEIVLEKVDANDDATWSRTIHCMTSVLEWLCLCSEIWMLENVMLLAESASLGVRS